jgi:hypothetical protein
MNTAGSCGSSGFPETGSKTIANHRATEAIDCFGDRIKKRDAFPVQPLIACGL